MSDLFDEIIITANLLISQTQCTDVLVFIGQSVNYLSYIVETQRTCIRVPISGRVFIDDHTIPSSEQLTAFKRMLDELGLGTAITGLRSGTNNLILIDHSHSGQSISSFGKLLNVLYDINITYDFINVVSSVQAYGDWIMRPNTSVIHTDKFLLMPSLVELANDKYPRSIPSYQYWKWLETPEWVGAETKKGLQLVAEMMEYYRTEWVSKESISRPDIQMISPLFGSYRETSSTLSTEFVQFPSIKMKSTFLTRFCDKSLVDIKSPEISMKDVFGRYLYVQREQQKKMRSNRQHFKKLYFNNQTQ
jgi:hypothetical protein